jgi:hypothetical protein
MISVTASEALSYARLELYRLAVRAIDETPAEQKYIFGLAESWAARLAEMSRGASMARVSDEAWRVLDRLTATINNPALKGEALVEWVDAFPEAVVDLLADRLVLAEPAPAPVEARPARHVAGNNQSALALAA